MPEPSLFPPSHDGLRRCFEQGEAELHALLSTRRSIPARSSIARSGEAQARMYRLRSGWAARIRYLPEGQAQISEIMLPCDLIGADSMFFNRQADDLIALSACEVDHGEPGEIWAAASLKPDLAARMMWHYCEDSRRLRNWVVAMGRGDAEQRVALLLIDIRARLIFAGQLSVDDESIPFPLTQQTIADTLGLTAVHVNRVLKKLKEDGIALIHGGRASLSVRPLAELAMPLMDGHERMAVEFGLTRTPGFA